MPQLREFDIKVEYVPDTFGHLYYLSGEGHRALAIYFPDRNGHEVTCDCDDPIAKGGKSKWFVNGTKEEAVRERFNAHLSYFNRPKTKAD